MHELKLAKNFIDQWMKQVGNWPTVDAVRHYLGRSVQVQRCMDLYHKDGTPYRVLAVYWNPELDLVIKVDITRWVAVTVFATDNWQCKADDGSFLPARKKPPRSRLSERVAEIRKIFAFRPATQ